MVKQIFLPSFQTIQNPDHLTTGHVWTIRILDLWEMVTEKANKTYCKLNNGTHLKNRHDLKTGHVI